MLTLYGAVSLFFLINFPIGEANANKQRQVSTAAEIMKELNKMFKYTLWLVPSLRLWDGLEFEIRLPGGNAV